ncbi:MAG: hypothetical protein ACREJ2_16535 [Planctomycetota bacterium]
MKKWIVGLIVAAVALLIVIPVGLLLIAWIFIDPIGKALIETGGSRELGVKTEVGAFHCSILSGSVAIHDMTVADPAGFDPTKPTLSMGQAATGVSLSSLDSNTLDIQELDLENLRVYLEANDKTTNVQTILTHLDQGDHGAGASGGSSGATGTPAPAAPAAPAPEKRFKIALIRLKNIGMDIHATWPVEYKTSFTIPPFEMHDLWRQDGSGYTASELLVEILNRATKAGLDVGGKDLQGVIKQRLLAALDANEKQLQTRVQAAAQQAGQELKQDATQSVKNAVQDATHGGNPADAAKQAAHNAGTDLKQDLGKLKNPFK